MAKEPIVNEELPEIAAAEDPPEAITFEISSITGLKEAGVAGEQIATASVDWSTGETEELEYALHDDDPAPMAKALREYIESEGKTADPAEPPDMAMLRMQAFEFCVRKIDDISASILRQYPLAVRMSWAQQEQEAIRAIAGTPLDEENLIERLAAQRNVSVSDMAVRISDKAKEFRQISVSTDLLLLQAGELLDETLTTPVKLDEKSQSVLAIIELAKSQKP